MAGAPEVRVRDVLQDNIQRGRHAVVEECLRDGARGEAARPTLLLSEINASSSAGEYRDHLSNT